MNSAIVKHTDKSMATHPMPTLANLRNAREEFKRIEPRDFFYWSVTKLVAAVLDSGNGDTNVNELVRVLMMLLTTWNRNYYRFFETRKPGMSLEEHFAELEAIISKHQGKLLDLRCRSIDAAAAIPEQEIYDIFRDFADVLGRVGAAKCLHLLAPGFFPLWDAAILKGYGLEKGRYRSLSDAERYLAFMAMTRDQITRLSDVSSFTHNVLKSLDEYNYCTFTKKVVFD